jgi:hypothetical protein
MQQNRLPSAAVAGGILVLIGLSLASSLSVAPAMAQATFTCTEVIGFSQTTGWYQGGFISSIPDSGNWQLRWYSGGSVDLWADPNFGGWSPSALVSRCSQGSSTPDRVVMNVSGDYNADPNWWARQTHQVIQNIQARYPWIRSIALQPVIGGPGGSLCPTSDPAASQPWVRATYNFAYIKQGLAMNTGGQVVFGASVEVRSCADYLDWAGHMVPDGYAAAGYAEAQFWASSSPPTPNSVPPTNTATRVPSTNTPSASTSTQSVVTFDDLANPNRPLTGLYGSLDWGSGDWWLAGRYAEFPTNSVSFNGPGLGSATINLPTARRLVQLDVDNGGSAPTTISLSCPGQLTVQVGLAPHQTTTIRTNWTGECSSLTISSTNGWDTNVDNIVLAGTSTSPTNTPPAVQTSTPTRTPTPTSTSTPTATAAPTNVSFDDLSSPNRTLIGQYPSGLIDWGSGAWYLSGPYASFRTNSVSFNGSAVSTASLDLPTPRVLLSLDVVNGGTTSSTVTLTCAGQPSVQVRLAPYEGTTLSTGWTAACTRVTISSTNGWQTNFDNVRLR